MKSTTIVFYFLPILLWLITRVNSSKDFDNLTMDETRVVRTTKEKNWMVPLPHKEGESDDNDDGKKFSKIDEADEFQAQPQNLDNKIIPEQSQKSRIFFNTENNEMKLPRLVLRNILYNYLSLRDLLEFRQTCQDLHTLVESNEKQLVTYLENPYWGKEKKTEVQLDWRDLRYFLSNSLNDAFYPVEVFNIKKYHYAILLRTNEIKTFPVYRTIPFETTFLQNHEKFFSFPNFSSEEFEVMRNRNSWFSITDEGNCELEDFFTLPQDTNLKQIKHSVSGIDGFSIFDPLGNYQTWGAKSHIVLFHDGRVFCLSKIPAFTAIELPLPHAQMLFSTKYEYAVLYDGGKVWMDHLVTDTLAFPIRTQELTGVKMLFGNARTFIVLFLDGHIEAHGLMRENIPEDVQEKLNGKKVIDVLPLTQGFRVFYEEGKKIREIVV